MSGKVVVEGGCCCCLTSCDFLSVALRHVDIRHRVKWDSRVIRDTIRDRVLDFMLEYAYVNS